MPARFESFDVPAGQRVDLQFTTGARGTIAQLRFVLGGNPDTKISRIVGVQNNLPDIGFEPEATPFAATVHFAQNPLRDVPSTDFVFSVANGGTRDVKLEIGAVYQ